MNVPSALKGKVDGASVLELRSVVAGYDGYPVVHVDHLRVLGGEVVALLGRSGCGKSTLLSAVGGMLPFQAGTTAIDGEPCDERARVRKVARTLQNFPLLHWLTVKGNLEVAAKIRGVPLKDPYAILTRFRAEHLLNRMSRTLSGGERCRASLAQAAVGAPRVLALDEPFTGLDTIVKIEVAETIFDFARQRDAAVLFVTHDLHDACEYANRAIVIAGQGPARVVGEVAVAEGNGVERIRGLMAGNAAA